LDVLASRHDKYKLPRSHTLPLFFFFSLLLPDDKVNNDNVNIAMNDKIDRKFTYEDK
jgi:hypothetical protein